MINQNELNKLLAVKLNLNLKNIHYVATDIDMRNYCFYIKNNYKGKIKLLNTHNVYYTDYIIHCLMEISKLYKISKIFYYSVETIHTWRKLNLEVWFLNGVLDAMEFWFITDEFYEKHKLEGDGKCLMKKQDKL